MATKKITRSDIYKKLSAENVNDNIEIAGRLKFLSWAWAWGILMKFFPNSTYTFLDDKVFDDGSMEVCVVLTIEDHDYLMWLPVMDHRHQAIPTPSSTAINKARMRCLTKCIAMAGLGFYIYAGEDLPEKTGEETATRRSPKKAAASPKHTPTNTASAAGPVLIPCGALKDMAYSDAIEDANVCQQHIDHWSKNAKTDAELKHLSQLKSHMTTFAKGVAA